MNLIVFITVNCVEASKPDNSLHGWQRQRGRLRQTSGKSVCQRERGMNSAVTVEEEGVGVRRCELIETNICVWLKRGVHGCC